MFAILALHCSQREIVGVACDFFIPSAGEFPASARLASLRAGTAFCRVTGLTPEAPYEFQVTAIFRRVDQPGPASAVMEHRAA